MHAAPTLVFDLDGTLAETAGDLIGALNFVLAARGIAPVPVEAARSLLGAGGRALIQRGFARAGRDSRPRSSRRCSAIFSPITTRISPIRRSCIPASRAALDAFAAAGWRQAMCTNKMEASAKLLIERLGVARPLRLHLRAGHVWRRQARPEPLFETIRTVGGGPEPRVMVGDLPTDIGTARAGGD